MVDLPNDRTFNDDKWLNKIYLINILIVQNCKVNRQISISLVLFIIHSANLFDNFFTYAQKYKHRGKTI